MKRCPTDRIRPLRRPSGTRGTRSLVELAIGVVLVLAAQLGLSSSASAEIIDRGPQEHEDHFITRNGCGVTGFTTRVDIVYRGHFIVRAKGKDQLPYLTDHWVGTIRFTNVETGKYVTISDEYTQADFSLVDNGDGTTTGYNRGRYAKVMRDAHGRKLASQRLRDVARWVVDNGGTPSDRSDDEELEWEVLKERGHPADFCAATVAAIAK